MHSSEPRGTSLAVVVLARNASRSIERTIRSIAGQDVFVAGSRWDTTVHVVVNGTTDATAALAAKAWEPSVRSEDGATALHVHVLDRSGKANAWNTAVHELAGDAPEVFVFCDADIVLDAPGTLRLLAEALVEHPGAIVATPMPRKSLDAVRSPAVRWLAGRGVNGAYSDDAIAGGCYALRGTFARSMELPRTVTVDDGFVHAMVLTDQFTTVPDPARVVRVPEASFVFEAEPDLRALADHERRLTIGGSYNAYAFRALHELCGPGMPAGPLLIERNRTTPRWIDELVLADKRQGRRWFVPRTYLTRRLGTSRKRLSLTALASLAVGLTGDVMVSVWANEYFRTFESSPVW